MPVCPSCHSTNTVKASVIHESGTSTSYTSGSGISTGSSQQLGTFSGTTTTQTRLAQKHSPPPFLFGVAMILIGGYFLYEPLSLIFGGYNLASILHLAGPPALAGLLKLLLSLAGFALGVWLVLSYPKHKREYDRTWVCMSCGRDFLE